GLDVSRRRHPRRAVGGGGVDRPGHVRLRVAAVYAHSRGAAAYASGGLIQGGMRWLIRVPTSIRLTSCAPCVRRWRLARIPCAPVARPPCAASASAAGRLGSGTLARATG